MMTSIEFEAELKHMQAKRIHSKYTVVSLEDIQRRGVILFGAGKHGKLVASSLLAKGVKPLWFIDNNTALHAKTVYDIAVRPLNSLAEAGSAYILLSSCHVRSMIADCQKYNNDSWILPYAIRNICSILADLGACQGTPELMQHVLSLFNILADDQSRVILKDFLDFQYTFSTSLFNHYDENIYFHPDFSKKIDYSVFVDAGAFNGDTLSDWIGKYEPKESDDNFEYYAFEPCNEQFGQLAEFVETLPTFLQRSISLYKIALGNRSYLGSLAGEGTFSHVVPINGTSRRFSNSPVKVCRFDDIFEHNCPTFIKADVEGSELAMLEGMSATIKRCRPSLAISVYHKYDDIWRIPLWLYNVADGYDIYLRHHSSLNDDTVCYAIPQAR